MQVVLCADVGMHRAGELEATYLDPDVGNPEQ